MAIYIVDDDVYTSEIEAYVLRSNGYKVECFGNGQDLLEACNNKLPQLLILDILLQEDDGISILKILRKRSMTMNIPVMIVTAKSSEIDIVRAFEVGADDYLTKPFGTMELSARVNALLRRTKTKEKGNVLQYKDIVIYDAKREVRSDDKIFNFTYKEYELLKTLIMNKGMVLPREKLFRNVWGYECDETTRTIDIHINTLRKKLGVQGQYIKAVRNIGYKIEE